jgi:hypothetical protein
MLKYEIQESENKAEFVVSAIDSQDRGEIYLALFSGSKAEEYAIWKNRAVDMPEVAPLRR